MNKSTMSPVHVAAAAVIDDRQRVFITRRPDHVHQGGLWEFPGGKVEVGESVADALARELQEEIGIQVQHSRPLIRVYHNYADKAVLLDVWRVDAFDGVAHGREGQPCQWVEPERLREFDFPEANDPIIRSVQLPDRYLITPDPEGDIESFLVKLESCLRNGIRLVQLRAKSLSQDDYIELATQVKTLCVNYGAKLILNCDPALVSVVGADGVNLTGERLWALNKRPLAANKWVSASCHTAEDLNHAELIHVDLAMLSPVQTTASHPDTQPIGWQKFHSLCERAPFPVYALGGVGPDDLDQSFACGAQGVAAIRALWLA